jgi:glycosyltransferase involved in cell wall biosynthesis
MPVGKEGGVITILLRDYMGGVYYNSRNLAVLLAEEGWLTSFILTEQTDRPSGVEISDLADFNSRLFTFSAADNKRYLFRKLAGMIPEASHVLILNDYLEYKLVTHRPIHQKVIGIVHGDYDYYYELALSSESRIDHFVCVSPSIAAKLNGLIPHRKNDIVFIPSLVPDLRVNRMESAGDGLRILFVGRLTPEKGFDLLPLIDEELNQRGIRCRWTVVAPHTTDLYDEWLHEPQVQYHDRIANKAMPPVYAQQDVLLLPSHAEGFPLSILEAMKCGVVPVVTNLPTLAGGLVNDGLNGFLFPLNDIPAICAILARLNEDKVLLTQTAERAAAHALTHFGESSLRKKWIELLNRKESGKDTDRPVDSIYDRMDLSWLPNAVTRGIRNLKARGKGNHN